MGIGVRQILVNDNDEVLLLTNRFYKKLWDKSPEGLIQQFAGRRVRWVEAAVEIQNCRPVAILRVIYSYMYFDAGRLDTDRLMQDTALKMEAGIGDIFWTRSDRVIHASSRFAARAWIMRSSGGRALRSKRPSMTPHSVQTDPDASDLLLVSHVSRKLL